MEKVCAFSIFLIITFQGLASNSFAKEPKSGAGCPLASTAQSQLGYRELTYLEVPNLNDVVNKARMTDGESTELISGRNFIGFVFDVPTRLRTQDALTPVKYITKDDEIYIAVPGSNEVAEGSFSAFIFFKHSKL